MSVDFLVEPDLASKSWVPAIASAPNVLTDIYQPENNIAVWERTLPSLLINSISDMLVQEPKLALVQTVTPDDAAQWVGNKLADYDCATALAEDIALIVDMFCCLFELKEVGLRLTALDKPMCPKFHVDRIPCRLVSTYAGTATQWLANHQIDRQKLGAGSLGQPDHLSGLYKDDAVIAQMSAGDVALLKGSGWEGNEDTGLVHRSPQLAANEQRLLLTLDMVS